MAKQRKKGYATQFGSRYGKTNRQKFEKVHRAYKGKQVCPYCHYEQVKRMAAGIWHCRKCASVFASRAYKVEKFPALTKSSEAEHV
ncbi:50S ribosomal protein L37ae [Candidatus Woesearchaeota archaeon]|nr:MAG: 50S ribosomal protein L37ae [Candidatus Woesearchaeota archaeon]